MARWGRVAVSVLVVPVAWAVPAPSPATASEYTEFEVTTTADVVDSEDGLLSLREAVSAASEVEAGDEVLPPRIVVPAGTYELTICDGTRAAEDDANVHGDLDYTGVLPLRIHHLSDQWPFPPGYGPEIRQACGSASGERVLDADAPVELVFVGLTGGDTPGAGGGVRAPEVTAWETLVGGNRAEGDGGGIAADEVALYASLVAGNESVGHGGGIAASTVATSAAEGAAVVSGNRAARDGGGVHASTAVALAGLTIVEGNVSDGDGGGVWSPDVVVQGDFHTEGQVHVLDNAAAGDGGGLRAGTLEAYFGEVERNFAGGRGGGAWVATTGSMRSTEVDDNVARGDGGGAWIGGGLDGDGDPYEPLLVRNNRSGLVGGGLHVGGPLELTRAVIEGNVAAGAAAVHAGGSLTLHESSLVGNRSPAPWVSVVPHPGSVVVIAGAGGSWLRNVEIRDNDPGEGAAVTVGAAAAGADHLLHLVTFVQNAHSLDTGEASVRVAGTVFADSRCTVGAAGLDGPDPSTAPPEALGHQPSYATSSDCDLRSPGSTNGGPMPAFEPGTAVPAWGSVLRGAVQFEPGVVVTDVRGLPRPSGAGGDIGAFEGRDPLVHVVAPARVLDTRASNPLGAGGVTEVAVAGTAGVPVGASAAVVNVTLVGPSEATHLTLWPAGSPRPSASTVNAGAGATVAAGAVVGLSEAGTVSIRNNAGTAHVLVDVVGWVEGEEEPPPGDPGLAVTPVAPVRAVDTRATSPLGADETRTMDLSGVVPVGASAAIVNVTGVAPSEATHLTVWAAGAPRPATSSLNLAAGQTAANLVVVPVSAAGDVSVRNRAGEVDVLVDVVGYLAPVPVGGVAGDSGLHVVAPVRAFDSRRGGGAPLASGVVHTVTVDTDRVPVHAGAVLATVTVVSPSADTHVTTWASGTPKPATSTLNTVAGVTRANLAVIPLDAEGRLDLRLSSGAAHVIVDVVGYLDTAPI